jgi:hypothetical protein
MSTNSKKPLIGTFRSRDRRNDTAMNTRSVPEPARRLPTADPRRPNRPLLIASIAALLAWSLFLLLVALRVI